MTEGVVEDACLEYLAGLGYEIRFGPDIGPEGEYSERDKWSDVVLTDRLRGAVSRINPQLPGSAVEDVVARVLRPESQNLLSENWRVHQLLTQGVPVEYRTREGSIRHDLAWLIDFDDLANNDWLAVNQLTVVEDGRTRRPDVVVFVNGLPLGLVELKNAGDEQATLKGAFNQIQTYRRDIPSAFVPNAVCVVSDGVGARMSTFTAGWEHYAPWRTVDGTDLAPTDAPQLDILIRGVFEHGRFLDLVRNFIVFSDEPAGVIKRVAKYHQFWAVNAAVESTVQASGVDGDRRGGVVWHTQGSGKSLEMLFYVAKIMRHPAMANPTVVLITDRNDLDDQLFGEVFAPARLLPERPKQAASRAELREMLAVASGGIVFTTMQKFAPDAKGDVHPLLTDRHNVVVVADEAHRSQYDFIDGLARHLRDALPNATFLGFTGTPIESTDRSTRQVFGDYVDIYDLTRAVEDGATVRIFYESRLAKVELPEDMRVELDQDFAELTEAEEETARERAKSRWARQEAIVGADERLGVIAADIVAHWTSRRSNLMGKAMIVCMSRRICAALYDKIIALRPDWHSDDDAAGKIKVIYTGSAMDRPEIQRHVRNKEALKALKSRAKNPGDELELVIVRDMWLTGFDSPSLHTMYVDKPMQGHGLMQAIARVNRTFRDKPGGLIVDYIGIAHHLRDALADYSSADRDKAGVPIDEVVAVMLEKHDVVCQLLHGHEWSSDPARPATEKVAQLAATTDFVLADPDRKSRFMDHTLALVKAFALCGSRDEAMAIRDDVAFLASVRSQIAKLEAAGRDGGRSGEELDTAISQLVSEAVAAEGVVDIYAGAGMERPDISILSDEFLDEITKSPQKNLQLELLKKLLHDEIRSVRRSNVVKHREFSEMLDDAIRRYQNRSLTTAQIIAELVDLAREIRDAKHRGDELGISDSELAFYDAVCQNDSAVLEMGDDVLKAIARDLVVAVRESTSIDWTIKESVRAGLRARVRRLLNRYDYPPDKADRAVELVIEQAELFASELAA